MMPGAGGDVNTTMPLIINAVGFFLCGWGCISAILFIVGFVFAIQAGNMKKTGDIAGAQAKAKSSMTMGVIGLVVGALLYIIGGILRAMNS